MVDTLLLEADGYTPREAVVALLNVNDWLRAALGREPTRVEYVLACALLRRVARR